MVDTTAPLNKPPYGSVDLYEMYKEWLDDESKEAFFDDDGTDNVVEAPAGLATASRSAASTPKPAKGLTDSARNSDSEDSNSEDSDSDDSDFEASVGNKSDSDSEDFVAAHSSSDKENIPAVHLNTSVYGPQASSRALMSTKTTVAELTSEDKPSLTTALRLYEGGGGKLRAFPAVFREPHPKQLSTLFEKALKKPAQKPKASDDKPRQPAPKRQRIAGPESYVASSSADKVLATSPLRLNSKTAASATAKTARSSTRVAKKKGAGSPVTATSRLKSAGSASNAPAVAGSSSTAPTAATNARAARALSRLTRHMDYVPEGL